MTKSRREAFRSGDPDYPIRLIPSGDEDDERRDKLNEQTGEQIEELQREFDRLQRLERRTQDPKLRAAYRRQRKKLNREMARLWLDIGADFIARLDKWAKEE